MFLLTKQSSNLGITILIVNYPTEFQTLQLSVALFNSITNKTILPKQTQNKPLI